MGDSWRCGCPLRFVADLRRPMSHFPCLLHHEELAEKGVQAIPHWHVDGFYQCLLRLGPSAIASMMRTGETSQRYFLGLLNGKGGQLDNRLQAPAIEEDGNTTELAGQAEAPALVPADQLTDLWRRCLITGPTTGAGRAPTYKVFLTTTTTLAGRVDTCFARIGPTQFA